MVQAYVHDARKILVINLKFVAEKFARMKKMPYLCNRYNKHIRLILLFTGNRVSQRAIQQQTKTLIGIDYE